VVNVSIGICVETGPAVRVEIGVGVDAGVTDKIGGGEKSRFATGLPNMADAMVTESRTNETISHCQPVTMRARRVR